MVPMTETVIDLLLKCTVTAGKGADFPTVWETVLKGHPLVAGSPIQVSDDQMRPQLEIALMNGQRLIYNSASNEYFILGAPR
jgi:hypothetical protein